MTALLMPEARMMFVSLGTDGTPTYTLQTLDDWITRVKARGRAMLEEGKMIKTIVLSMCLAASSLSLKARAQDVRQYADGPVTEYDYVRVEYGHFEEYIDWLNSTWKPRRKLG